MIKNVFLNFIFIASSCVFTSCLSTYGDNIMRHYTLLRPDTSHLYPVDKPVAVFFEGEPIAFDYDKMGIIEVKGDQYCTTANLLDHLKYEAMKNGANGVIGVKDAYATRQSGLLFSKTPPTEYSSHIYSGIAVKLKVKDSAAIGNFNGQNDLAYIKRVRDYDVAYSRKSGNRVTASFVLILVLIGLGIYVVANK